MEEITLTTDSINRLIRVCRKAGGPRRVCDKAGINTDVYWNLRYGKSRNADAYRIIFHTAVDLIIEEDDYGE